MRNTQIYFIKIFLYNKLSSWIKENVYKELRNKNIDERHKGDMVYRVMHEIRP